MRGRLAVCIAMAAVLGLSALALASMPFRSFLVRRGEEPGFTPRSPQTLYRTARDWLASGDEKGRRLNSDTARLKQHGFVRALVEHTTYDASPDNGGGISWVMELGSLGSARSEQRALMRQDIADAGKRARVARFSVTGVPGATGWTLKILGRPGSAANVLFTEGRCLLLVGDLTPQGDPATPAKAASRAVDRRTKGTCP